MVIQRQLTFTLVKAQNARHIHSGGHGVPFKHRESLPDWRRHGAWSWPRRWRQFLDFLRPVLRPCFDVSILDRLDDFVVVMMVAARENGRRRDDCNCEKDVFHVVAPVFCFGDSMSAKSGLTTHLCNIC